MSSHKIYNINAQFLPLKARYVIMNKISQISFGIKIYSFSIKTRIYIQKSRDKCQSNGQIYTVPDVRSNRNEFRESLFDVTRGGDEDIETRSLKI